MPFKKFVTTGKTVINGDIKDGEVVLTYPDASTTNGIGDFIDQKAFKKYLDNTYKDELTTLQRGEDGSDEKVIFDIGKTALLFLLCQSGCEGIRLIKIKKGANNEPSFIIHGITNKTIMVGNKKLSMSMEGIDGNDPTRDEEIHNFTLQEVYTVLKKELGWKDDKDVSDLFNSI